MAERKIALDKKIELIAEQILTLRNSSDPMADHSRAVELVKVGERRLMMYYRLQ